MLTAKRGRRKIRAMVLKEPVDQCLGVVQCALPGCEAHMPIIVDADSAGDQVDWFLDNHECRALGRKS
jgi:hypothetical protein